MKFLFSILTWTIALSFSAPAASQFGKLTDVIEAGRGGCEPAYIRELMDQFGAILRQFVIDQRVRSPDQMLDLFGVMVDMTAQADRTARLCGYYRQLPDNFWTQEGDPQSLSAACDVIKSSWIAVFGEGNAPFSSHSEELGELPNTVYVESCRLLESELEAGRSMEQARNVRYRFAEWKILNQIFDQSLEKLARFYSHPRLKWHRDTHWQPSANHPHPHCDHEWCNCNVYAQDDWYEKVPNWVSSIPMANAAAWLDFRMRHFSGLSRDVWVYLMPWIGVIDALVFGPAIVQFNVGRLSKSSSIHLLPAEIICYVSVLVAPRLFKK